MRDILIAKVCLTIDGKVIYFTIGLNKLFGVIVALKLNRLEIVAIQGLVDTLFFALHIKNGGEVFSTIEAHTIMNTSNKNLGAILVCAGIKLHVDLFSIQILLYYKT